MKSHGLLSLALATGTMFSACQSAPEAQPAPKEASSAEASASLSPAPEITWPAVTQVLDGTDLIALDEIKLTAFSAADSSGEYHSEQGGSILSLTVKPEGGNLQVERRLQEPGEDPHVRQYRFVTVSAEGATTEQQDAFVRQTSEGLIVLEQKSEVDTIPATYWVHYIRKK